MYKYASGNTLINSYLNLYNLLKHDMIYLTNNYLYNIDISDLDIID